MDGADTDTAAALAAMAASMVAWAAADFVAASVLGATAADLADMDGEAL